MQRRWTSEAGQPWSDFPPGVPGEFEEIRVSGMPLVMAVDTEAGLVWLNIPDAKGKAFLTWTGTDFTVARAKVRGKVEARPGNKG